MSRLPGNKDKLYNKSQVLKLKVHNLDKSEWENYTFDDEDDDSELGRTPAEGKTLKKRGDTGEDRNGNVRKIDLNCKYIGRTRIPFIQKR